MRELTDRPFGVNIAQAFVRDPAIAEFVIEQGVKFVTTSAGSPTKYTSHPQGSRADRVPRGADPRARRSRRSTPASTGWWSRAARVAASRARPRGLDDGAAAADPLAGRRADHRRRRDLATGHHGRRLRARCRGRADGHAHGVGRRVTRARQLEAGDRRRRRDRHAVPEPAPLACVAGAAHGAHDRACSTPSSNVFGEFGNAIGALLRRRHGGGDRTQRTGGGAHRVRCGRSPTSSPTPCASSARPSPGSRAEGRFGDGVQWSGAGRVRGFGLGGRLAGDDVGGAVAGDLAGRLAGVPSPTAC